MKQPLRFLLALLVTLLAGRAFAMNCGPAFAELLSEGAKDSAIYQCGRCFFNAGELARKAAARFGRDIDPEKMTILVIKYQELSDPMIPAEDIPLPWLLVGLKSKKHHPDSTGRGIILWKYHSVLEYEGQILDLDSEEARPLSRREYFEQMFSPLRDDFAAKHSFYSDDRIERPRDYNQWSKMEIYQVPAVAYFAKFGGRPADQSGTDLSFIWKYPRTGLLDYINRGTTAAPR